MRLLALIAAAAVIAAAIGFRSTRRLLLAAAALGLLYALLKLTGAIDALRPDRIGVF